jgi:hypothetical protein
VRKRGKGDNRMDREEVQRRPSGRLVLEEVNREQGRLDRRLHKSYYLPSLPHINYISLSHPPPLI